MKALHMGLSGDEDDEHFDTSGDGEHYYDYGEESEGEDDSGEDSGDTEGDG